ncbi:hypothetical protein PYCC9005_002632 [Savitreella phatthalungensis]
MSISTVNTVPIATSTISRASFECSWPGCGKTFKRSEHLNRHRLNHEPIKIFECDQCPKTFVRSDLLFRHKDRHAKRILKRMAQPTRTPSYKHIQPARSERSVSCDDDIESVQSAAQSSRESDCSGSRSSSIHGDSPQPSILPSPASLAAVQRLAHSVSPPLSATTLRDCPPWRNAQARPHGIPSMSPLLPSPQYSRPQRGEKMDGDYILIPPLLSPCVTTPRSFERSSARDSAACERYPGPTLPSLRSIFSIGSILNENVAAAPALRS